MKPRRTHEPLPQRLLAMASSLTFGCLALFAVGCGASWPAVIDPSEIAFLREGRPQLRRVRDLGAVHIGRPGPLLAESDGQFAIGELVLIEGSGLGKQPTVTIAGRPASIRWRTDGGGIVAQVPAGSAVGAQQVIVQGPAGRSELPLTLDRLVLVLDGRHGQLQTVRLGQQPGGEPTLTAQGAPLPLAHGRALAMAADGAAAYVLTDDGSHSSVAIVDLVAAGGPRIFATRPLGHRADKIVAAEQAGVLAMVGSDQLTLWDIRESRRPAAWPAAALPAVAHGCRAAALSPDGETLALSLGEGNQLLLLTVKPGQTQVVPELRSQLAVLPGNQLPLLHGLRFAADGHTLWLSAGDSPASLTAGHQPTRIIAVELHHPEAAAAASPSPDIGAAILKTIDLRDAGPPAELALAKAPPLFAGSTIRTPPEKATVFLTTTGDGKGAGGGALWRSDLLGQLRPIYSSSQAIGGLDVSPDARFAVVSQAGNASSGRQLTVTDLLTSRAVSLPLGLGNDDPAAAEQVQILLQP